MFDGCVCYMIVVEHSDASNYYYNYCKPSWQSVGIRVNKFSAVTSKTINACGVLSFAEYSTAMKYVSKNIKAEITDTEKACWCSHFMLWAECAYSRKPMLIIEHDSFLEDPTKLWRDDSYGVIFYDKAAMGSYLLQPWLAKIFVEQAMNTVISGGPYSFIADVSRKLNLQDKIVNDQHPKYNPASNQVMSNKYGNTIEHYSNLHPELFSDKFFHKFIPIE